MSKEDLRNTILAEQDLIASRRRFGLFSQPASLAICDNGAYITKLHERGPDGKPITLPRNMLSSAPKSGKSKSSYFGGPQLTYQNHPYVEKAKQDLRYEAKMHTKGSMHQVEFKPASGMKIIANSSYQYIQQKQGLKKTKVQRDQTGKVKTEQRNIVTNPTQTVQRKFLKFPKYQVDPFERKHQLQIQEVKRQKTKNIHEVAFKRLSHGNRTFTKNSQIYGEDDLAKKFSQQKSNKPIRLKTTTATHQCQFKPAIKPVNDLIGKYPQFMSRRVRTQTSEIMKKTSQKTAQAWKPPKGALSRPTPSISLNMKNLGLAKIRR